MALIKLQSFSSSVVDGFTEYNQNVGIVTLNYWYYNLMINNITKIYKSLYAVTDILYSNLGATQLRTFVHSKGIALKVKVRTSGNATILTDQLNDLQITGCNLEMLNSSLEVKWQTNLKAFSNVRYTDGTNWFLNNNTARDSVEVILPASYSLAIILQWAGNSGIGGIRGASNTACEIEASAIEETPIVPK